MKVIPFKQPDDIDFGVDLVEDIRLDGIPFKWESNLSKEQLREIYQILLGERFFVRGSPGFSEESSEKVSLGFSGEDWIQETAFEYAQGVCTIIRLEDKLWAIYHTAEQYDAWLKEEDRIEKVKKYHAAQIEKLEIQAMELLETADGLVEQGRSDEAEPLYLQWRKLHLDNPKVFSTRGRLQERLIDFYRRYNSPSKGIEFLGSISDDALGRQGYYLYCLLAKYYADQPPKVEQIYTVALNRYPNEGQLYKHLCLYLAKEEHYPPEMAAELLDKAIRYCQQAIKKGLTDDTKSGFVGRLKRLEIQQGRLSNQ